VSKKQTNILKPKDKTYFNPYPYIHINHWHNVTK